MRIEPEPRQFYSLWQPDDLETIIDTIKDIKIEKKKLKREMRDENKKFLDLANVIEEKNFDDKLRELRLKIQILQKELIAGRKEKRKIIRATKKRKKLYEAKVKKEAWEKGFFNYGRHYGKYSLG